MCFLDWPQARHPHLSASIGCMDGCKHLVFFCKICFYFVFYYEKNTSNYFIILGHFEFQLSLLVIVLADLLKLSRIMNILMLI